MTTMTGKLSPLAALRARLAASADAPRAVAEEFLAKANGNASRNSYLNLLAGEAVERAERLPNLFASGRPALYGVPVSIKDCFDFAGTVTTCGSRYYAETHPVATGNSWVAQRLLDVGAVVTGKTHLHQLAYGITGENADYGDCVQPRDARLLTGGSSSGAVASVQEGSALAAIGTDTGGSVRVPAALCGLAGYRASVGMSRGEERWAGGAHLAPSFDAIGLLFRDLRDAAELGAAVFDFAMEPAPGSVRIGYVDGGFLEDCEPDVLEAYGAWRSRLSRHGATLSPVDTSFWPGALEIFAPIQASEAAAIHRGRFEHFEPAIAQRLEWGASIGAEELAALRARHAIFRGQMTALFAQFDLLIAPCAPMTRLFVGQDQSKARNAILRYTVPVSLAGLPAVTLPGEAIGAAFGTGVQLIGPAMQDAMVLSFASTLVEGKE